MFCSKCAAQIPDDSLVCPQCQAPIPQLDATTPQTNTDMQQPVYDNSNYQQAQPQMQMQPNAQMQYIPNPNNVYQPYPYNQPKSKKRLFIGLSIAAALIIAAIAILLVFLFKGKGEETNPFSKVINAGKNTIFAGFDFEFTAYTVDKHGEKEVESEMTGFLTMDLNKHKIEAFSDETYEDYYYSSSGKTSKQSASIIDGDKVGSAYIRYEDGKEDYSYGYLDYFSDMNDYYYYRSVDFSEDAVFNSLKILRDSKVEKIDYRKLFDCYGDISDYVQVLINPDDIDDLTRDLINVCNKNRDKLGFKKSGNTYSLDFELSEAYEIVYPVFEEYISGLAKRYIMEEIDHDFMDDMKEIYVHIDTEIEGDYMTSFVIKVQPKAYTNTTYVIEMYFDNVGKCKSKIDDKFYDLMEEDDY